MLVYLDGLEGFGKLQHLVENDLCLHICIVSQRNAAFLAKDGPLIYDIASLINEIYHSLLFVLLKFDMNSLLQDVVVLFQCGQTSPLQSNHQ